MGILWIFIVLEGNGVLKNGVRGFNDWEKFKVQSFQFKSEFCNLMVKTI